MPSPTTPEVSLKGSGSSTAREDVEHRHFKTFSERHRAEVDKFLRISRRVPPEVGSMEPHRKRQRIAEFIDPSTSGKSCTNDTDEYAFLETSL